MAGRPKKNFTDALEIFLETSPEEEIRDALIRFDTWARMRKFKFRVQLKAVGPIQVVNQQ